jgi:peroxiredoxin
MFRCRQSWTLVVVACLAAACWGCRSGDTPNGPEESNGQSGENGGQHPPRGNSPTTGSPGHQQEPAPAPTIPKVAMTKELLTTCLVQVGDTMPDAELSDLDGKSQPLAGLRGPKLTVLCFWKSGESLAGELKSLEILADLQDLYAADMEKGVRVVGINEGDLPEVVRKRVADAKATFPNLLDPDGAFFDKVATQRLPRVYLLDPEGVILWFDLEFSPTTRRHLKEAVQVALGEI